MSLTIRSAVEDDQAHIDALIKGERLNPVDIAWFNFIVATLGNAVVGAVQIRRHADGARELGSLVVVPGHRGHGLAQRLVDAALNGEHGDVFMITRRAQAERFRRWGFREIGVDNAPGAVRRNFRMGHYGGRIMAVLQRRSFTPLVVLERQALPHRRREQFLAAQWF